MDRISDFVWDKTMRYSFVACLNSHWYQTMSGHTINQLLPERVHMNSINSLTTFTSMIMNLNPLNFAHREYDIFTILQQLNTFLLQKLIWIANFRSTLLNPKFTANDCVVSLAWRSTFKESFHIMNYLIQNLKKKKKYIEIVAIQ